MALLFRGKSRCPICEQVIATEDEVVMSPAFMNDASHPLWKLNDSAMHASCFAAWPQKQAFIEAFNEHYALHYRGMRAMDDNGIIHTREPRQT